MSDYKIGTSQGALVDLIDEPFPTEITDEIVGFTLAGNPINVAMQKITWQWTNMSQAGWNQLIAFWQTNVQIASPPQYVYVTQLKETGTGFEYGTYRCRMGKPTSTVPLSLGQIRNAELIFYQAELIA